MNKTRNAEMKKKRSIWIDLARTEDQDVVLPTNGLASESPFLMAG